MEWCSSMPKIELHAHLNGSIRDSTLLELARESGERGALVFADVESVIRNDNRTLFEVFKMFDLIHTVTTDHKTVTRISKEVVEDFAADSVVYLELRTTPKRNDSRGMSKHSYMQAVLEGIKSVDTVDVGFCDRPNVDVSGNFHPVDDLRNSTETGRKRIYVRLLLSIDRRETAEAAMETVNLALELRNLGVVGIDLSGNPLVGEWPTFAPVLKFANSQGLPITLHCGEVPNPDEIRAMLDFRPRRIGHACCFDDDHWELLKKLKIPVEICLTSNIKTKTIASADVHHFADLYTSNHPLVLCTDDAGVFSTSLSAEYSLASSTFGLGKKEIFRLAHQGIDYIFASDVVKDELKSIFAGHVKLRPEFRPEA